NLEDICTTEGCTEPEFSDAVTTANTLEIVSYIGLSVGIVGVMTGIAMTLLGRGESDTAFVAPLPGGGIVGYTGTF
ncbi:MAG TPA: hypothetical protein VFB62_02275, partial [Polyangiaceae bacterium]|nr:hypothetical protein [Polyangiaceae bacterium]